MLVADDQGNYIEANQAAADMFGYSIQQLQQMNVSDLKTEQQPVKKRYNDFVEAGQDRGEFTFIKNGNTHTALYQAIRIKSDFNLSILIDITERKSAEQALKESEEKYKALFENANDAIFLAEVDTGIIKDANPKAEILLGLKKKEIIGMHHSALHPPEEKKAAVESFRHSVSAGENTKIKEMNARHSNGKIIPIEISPAAVTIKGKNYLFGAFRDITERKKAEQSLQQSEAKYRELSTAKDKFFSIISHDLKSAFNSVTGFSDLALKKLRKQEYDKVYKYNEIINQTSMQTYNLLINLLQWARLQTGSLQFNPELLHPELIVQNIFDLLNANFEEKQIQTVVNIPENLTIFADKNMLETIIRNLTSNAIKYTPENGTISFTAKEDDDLVLIEIEDNGIGIKAENIDKLFRIENSFSTPGLNKEKGTGLGLILCKEFTEKHGGKIWAESTVGIGSKFSFTLKSHP